MDQNPGQLGGLPLESYIKHNLPTPEKRARVDFPAPLRVPNQQLASVRAKLRREFDLNRRAFNLRRHSGILHVILSPCRVDIFPYLSSLPLPFFSQPSPSLWLG